MISLDQALDAGLSLEAVHRRVAAHRWHHAGHRVYQAADHEETPRSRVFAAVLSLGDDATVIGRTAAWWWRLRDEAPGPIEVAVARPRQPRPRPGVLLRRRGVDPEDRVVVRGVHVTKKAPTVLDAAVGLGLPDGARLIDRALQREAVTLEALREVHARTSGRRGAVLAARLLALAAGGARSEAERLSHRVLRAAGIDGWTANTEIVLPGFGRAVGDIVFARERVVVEVDGWAYHRDLRAFLRDGPRQAALAAEGWVVVRTHWYQLTEEPDAFVAALVRTLLDRRSAFG